MTYWRVALTAVLLVGPAAAAQPPADWATNEVVVVTAQPPGPAFWHIKKGDSEIWILGTIAEMPKGQSWNSRHLSEVIEGAHAVLIPPVASTAILSAGWFLLTHHDLLSMPDGKKLEETLPLDMRARFVAARTSLGIPAEKFEDDSPILVGFELQNKFGEAAKLDSHEPIGMVKKIAGEKHVSLHPVADYSALDIVKEALRLPLAAQEICLDESLERLAHRRNHAAALAEAWAVGDLKAIEANYAEHSFSKCAKQIPSFGRVADQAVKDYLKAVEDALSKPGKTVMLADIGSLLRGTGVVEQLHAKGFVIEGPAE